MIELVDRQGHQHREEQGDPSGTGEEGGEEENHQCQAGTHPSEQIGPLGTLDLVQFLGVGVRCIRHVVEADHALLDAGHGGGHGALLVVLRLGLGDGLGQTLVLPGGRLHVVLFGEIVEGLRRTLGGNGDRVAAQGGQLLGRIGVLAERLVDALEESRKLDDLAHLVG